jgi:hypothetical protein
MVTESDVNKLVDRVEKVTKQKKMDLTSDADLSIGIMNLISLEGHLFFSAEETHKDEYLDILLEIRQMRIELLKKIIVEYEGEVWCISKHLLSACMRLMETGTKQLAEGNKEDAKLLFEKSYRLYRLFWDINAKTIMSREADVPVEESNKDKIEGVIPIEEEIQGKERIVFVPVCQEPI